MNRIKLSLALIALFATSGSTFAQTWGAPPNPGPAYNPYTPYPYNSAPPPYYNYAPQPGPYYSGPGYGYPNPRSRSGWGNWGNGNTPWSSTPFGNISGPWDSGPWNPNWMNNRNWNNNDVFNDWPGSWMDPADPRGSISKMWDDMLEAPNEMGEMPGGWTAPSIKVPNPVDVGDEFEGTSRKAPKEAADQLNNFRFN